jgi:hypothetical protein
LEDGVTAKKDMRSFRGVEAARKYEEELPRSGG